MTDTTRRVLPYALIGIAGLLAPVIAPAYVIQLALLWMMVLFALTWDLCGGQMGYNSFGNILFFGIGCYIPAVMQRELFYGLEEYETVKRQVSTVSSSEYFTGFALGMALAIVIAVAVAAVLGSGILGLRGHYFAIATLGLGIAAGEIASGWEYIGAGSGMLAPMYPGEANARGIFF